MIQTLLIGLLAGVLTLTIHLCDLYGWYLHMDLIAHGLGGIFVASCTIALLQTTVGYYEPLILGSAWTVAWIWEWIEARIPWATRYGPQDTTGDVLAVCVGAWILTMIV